MPQGEGRLFKEAGERREGMQRLRVEASCLVTAQESSATLFACSRHLNERSEAERSAPGPTRLPFAQTTVPQGMPKPLT